MFFTTLVTALGLAMDAVAVAIASGLSVKTLRWQDALKMALFFGIFQALMPMGGYFVGALFANALAAFDHWIATATASIARPSAVTSVVKNKLITQRK